MAKFKIGDIVKVTDKDHPRFRGIYFVDEEDTCPRLLDVDSKHSTACNENGLTLATGYDAIVKGTVLKCKNGNTVKVLAIIGDLYGISKRDHSRFGEWLSRNEVETFCEPPTPTKDKGIEVFDKDSKSLGFMKEGKVITN